MKLYKNNKYARTDSHDLLLVFTARGYHEVCIYQITMFMLVHPFELLLYAYQQGSNLMSSVKLLSAHICFDKEGIGDVEKKTFTGYHENGHKRLAYKQIWCC